MGIERGSSAVGAHLVAAGESRPHLGMGQRLSGQAVGHGDQADPAHPRPVKQGIQGIGRGGDGHADEGAAHQQCEQQVPSGG